MSEEQTVRPFADVLRDVRGGDLHEELSVELGRLVAAVESTGLAGKLVLTINVKAMKARGRVLVSDSVKASLPEVRDDSVFFAHEGKLTRRDPNQPELFGEPILVDASAIGENLKEELSERISN